MLQTYKYFFSSRKQKILIQDMEAEQDSTHPIYEANCPTVKKSVPPFSQISVHFQLHGF
jgi:hypothetical protein